MPPAVSVRKPVRRKKSTWKDINRKRTFSHRLKLIAIVFAGIVVSALFFGGLSIFQFLKAPLSLASGSFPEGRVWDKTSALNLALIVTNDSGLDIEELGLLTADKYQGSVSIANLSVSVPIDYPLGLGFAPLSQAIVLGDSLTPPVGVGMVEKVIKKILAVPVDRYVLIKESDLREFPGNPAEFKEILRIKNLPNLASNVDFVRNHVSTNLSLGEMTDLALFLRGVDPTKVYQKDFSGLQDLTEIDAWWSAFYTQGLFKQQRTPVLVLNGTNREGLGSWGGRVVNNLGGDTLTSINSYGTYSKTFIVTDKPDLPVVKALGRFFDIATVSRVGEGAGGAEYSASRAEVTLVLGLDAASVL